MNEIVIVPAVLPDEMRDAIAQAVYDDNGSQRLWDAVLAAAPSPWRPIETGPLDGTPVLLFVPGVTSWNRKEGMPDIVVGLFFTREFSRGGRWYSDIGDVDQGYESTGAYYVHEELQPTHWMPLPHPPQEG